MKQSFYICPEVRLNPEEIASLDRKSCLIGQHYFPGDLGYFYGDAFSRIPAVLGIDVKAVEY